MLYQPGTKVGRWTLTEKLPDAIDGGGRKRAQWACVCDCGTARTVVERNLKDGQSRSCGCIQKEQRANSFKTMLGRGKSLS